SVIDVDDEVAGLQLGKIAEESGSANLSAGALEGGRDFKEVGMAEKRDASVGESYACREGSTEQPKRGRFMPAFGGETNGAVFGFGQNVRGFVFAANVGEALKLAGAGGSEEDFATCFELRFHVTHAGDDVAVETGAGTGGQLKMGSRTDVECELFE